MRFPHRKLPKRCTVVTVNYEGLRAPFKRIQTRCDADVTVRGQRSYAGLLCPEHYVDRLLEQTLAWKTA